MRRVFGSVIVALCMSPGLSACVTSAQNINSPVPVSTDSVVDQEAKLHAGDRVQVTVFGEAGITGNYDVMPSGAVQLPLAGSVAAEGRSARELESAVTTALRRTYLRDPKVTVAIVTQRPFYVLGEVEKPGEYPYRSGLNLWRALAVAGGQTYRASTSSVLIQHAGQTQLAEYDLSRDLVIAPGDLIRVPERWF